MITLVVATIMYKLQGFTALKRRQINKIREGHTSPKCHVGVSSDSVNQIIFNKALLSLGPLDCNNKLWPIVQIKQ